MKKENIIISYFEDFVDAFATYSGDRVAKKFDTPYLVRQASGESKIFDTISQVSSHFQKHLDEYKTNGCSECRYLNLKVVWLGAESALASVDWELLNSSGEKVLFWSESYLLSIHEDYALAYASIDHAT